MQKALSLAPLAVKLSGSASSRSASSLNGPASFGSTAYQFLFKRNVTYIAYIATGAIVLEGVFGTVSKSFWSSMNSGRMYENTDWSKFEEK